MLASIVIRGFNVVVVEGGKVTMIAAANLDLRFPVAVMDYHIIDLALLPIDLDTGFRGPVDYKEVDVRGKKLFPQNGIPQIGLFFGHRVFYLRVIADAPEAIRAHTDAVCVFDVLLHALNGGNVQDSRLSLMLLDDFFAETAEYRTGEIS